MKEETPHYRVVVIGSGFGGTMTALPLADAFKERGKKEKVLILERGTWWTTPVSTVQDKEVRAAEHLAKAGQPVQFWSSQNHFRGFIDIFTRCFRRTRDVNIFTRIFERTLARLAEKLRPDGSDHKFFNPFLTGVADSIGNKSIALSHPLGGCRMADDATGGVVDGLGRVFDKSKTGGRPYYEGLYIADASIIPTALGVNPSLTISALALRIADEIVEELKTRWPASGQPDPPDNPR